MQLQRVRKRFISQQNHFRTSLFLVRIMLYDPQIYYHICVPYHIYPLAKQFATILMLFGMGLQIYFGSSVVKLCFQIYCHKIYFKIPWYFLFSCLELTDRRNEQSTLYNRIYITNWCQNLLFLSGFYFQRSCSACCRHSEHPRQHWEHR